MFDGKFHWWFGVVEERDDSTALDGYKLGRVRVRVMGLHSPFRNEDNDNGEGIPTNKLHWAYPMMPINSASMNGIGESPTGIVEGTNVFGFSRDGDNYQELIIMGTFGGVPQERPNYTVDGFSDPKQVYPKADFLKEEDTNRLARNEKIDKTIVQTKKDTVTKSVYKALGGTWNQPPIPYAATYPYNHVKETESGHIVEFDDTKGNERIHQYHRAGTFYEIDKEGTQVEKIVKDNYQIILGDDYIHVQGQCNVNIGGDATVYVHGNMKAEVNGNLNTKTHGDEYHEVKGNYSLQVAGNIDVDGSRIDLN